VTSDEQKGQKLPFRYSWMSFWLVTCHSSVFFRHSSLLFRLATCHSSLLFRHSSLVTALSAPR
jgi:hypothetical protein